MIRLGKYKHSKSGKNYLVIGEALHTEDEEILVLYKPLYGRENFRKKVFARPKKMFLGEIKIGRNKVRRFEFFEDD